VRTSEFIAALAADPVPEPIRLGRRVAAALAIGFLGSLAIYFLSLGPRPDIAAACGTMRFWLKFVDSFAFALPSLLLTLRLARPNAKPRALALWLIAPFILLAAGVIAELVLVPQSEWMSRLMGANAMHCTITIPMLAAPILAALIVALRAGAPLHAALTGALAGAASAGVAALLYASSCPDDSPLFVATWYPLATLICMGVGALAGRRFLAWRGSRAMSPARSIAFSETRRFVLRDAMRPHDRPSDGPPPPLPQGRISRRRRSMVSILPCREAAVEGAKMKDSRDATS
jgi:hypothetical protein